MGCVKQLGRDQETENYFAIRLMQIDYAFFHKAHSIYHIYLKYDRHFTQTALIFAWNNKQAVLCLYAFLTCLEALGAHRFYTSHVS